MGLRGCVGHGQGDGGPTTSPADAHPPSRWPAPGRPFPSPPALAPCCGVPPHAMPCRTSSYHAVPSHRAVLCFRASTPPSSSSCTAACSTLSCCAASCRLTPCCAASHHAALCCAAQGFNPAEVAELYGDSLYFFDWTTRKLIKEIHLGPTGLIPLEVGTGWRSRATSSLTACIYIYIYTYSITVFGQILEIRLGVRELGSGMSPWVGCMCMLGWGLKACDLVDQGRLRP